MGFLNRKKEFIPTRVTEVRAMRPTTTLDGDRYGVLMRIELEDGQKLDLQFDTRQFKILAVNSYHTAQTMNIEVTNAIAEKAAIWWGMSGG